MWSKDLFSSWKCARCGTVHSNDDSSDEEGWGSECWRCNVLEMRKNASAIANLRKEIKKEMEGLKPDEKNNLDRSIRAIELKAGVKLGLGKDEQA
jgi:DNA-directed RNA polymerase subunit RPC12/RpoP